MIPKKNLLEDKALINHQIGKLTTKIAVKKTRLRFFLLPLLSGFLMVIVAGVLFTVRTTTVSVPISPAVDQDLPSSLPTRWPWSKANVELSKGGVTKSVGTSTVQPSYFTKDESRYAVYLPVLLLLLGASLLTFGLVMTGLYYHKKRRLQSLEKDELTLLQSLVEMNDAVSQTTTKVFEEETTKRNDPTANRKLVKTVKTKEEKENAEMLKFFEIRKRESNPSID